MNPEQDLNYHGCMAYMNPSKFAMLAKKGNDVEERAESIADLVRSGKTIAPPCLFIDISPIYKGETAFVVSHEGRARAMAVEKLVDAIEIPVALILKEVKDKQNDYGLDLHNGRFGKMNDFTRDYIVAQLLQGVRNESGSRTIKIDRIEW